MDKLSQVARLFSWLNINRKEHTIPKQPNVDLSPKDLKELVVSSLDNNKAEDIVVIDLNEQSALADYMVIASGTSSRHVSALAENLKTRLEMEGIKNSKIEGLQQSDWVAMDIGDIVIHLFRPEVRAFYDLEKMWSVPAASFYERASSDHHKVLA